MNIIPPRNVQAKENVPSDESTELIFAKMIESFIECCKINSELISDYLYKNDDKILKLSQDIFNSHCKTNNFTEKTVKIAMILKKGSIKEHEMPLFLQLIVINFAQNCCNFYDPFFKLRLIDVIDTAVRFQELERLCYYLFKHLNL
uniref:Uncharacterized protein n=1 Tax=Panagrolaimus sp. JU765 TaxID=591449 RepID=A0AC34Q7V4_9BILA